MKTIKVTFTVGYGRHTDSLVVDDNATEQEINEMVEDLVRQRLDWDWTEV